MSTGKASNVIALHQESENAGAPTGVNPLEEMLGEITRTSLRIAWLGRIVDQLGLNELFGDTEIIDQVQSEGIRQGKVHGAQGGSIGEQVRWMLANERQTKTTQTKRRLATHPAYQLYLAERKHLVDTTSRALSIGIKLDHIELSKRQGEQMLQGMLAFAELVGVDVESDVVKSALARAVESVAVQ
jgi:hypothetical protein